jgi:hypothetical protein
VRNGLEKKSGRTERDGKGTRAEQNGMEKEKCDLLNLDLTPPADRTTFREKKVRETLDYRLKLDPILNQDAFTRSIVSDR